MTYCNFDCVYFQDACFGFGGLAFEAKGVEEIPHTKQQLKLNAGSLTVRLLRV